MPLTDHLKHNPTESGHDTMELIRRAVICLDYTLTENLPDGRDKSLALTKLEEVRMWAMKSISHNNFTSIDKPEIDGPAM